MLRNYLATALRNMARNRLYAVINIAGLAIGFSAALLIALFVRDELSYDKWLPHAERTYLVIETVHLANGSVYPFDQSAVQLASLLTDGSHGVEMATRLAASGAALRHGEFEANETVWWADPNVFEVLSLRFIAGDAKTALADPDGLVITRAIAQKYFGRDAPIGETIELNRTHPLHVTAVLEDLPSNITLKGQIFASGRAQFSRLAELEAASTPQYNVAPAVYTFLRLFPGTDRQQFNDDMQQTVQRNFAQAITLAGSSGIRDSFSLLSLAELHLAPGRAQTMTQVGSRPVLLVVSIVGLLIVAIASINFVNLVVARGSQRAVEVGVRKVSGAYRRHLMAQFIGEALICAAISVVLGACLAESALPIFSTLLGHEFAARIWRDPILILSAVGLALAVGLVAGAYPALVLSSYRPAAVVKGGFNSAEGRGGVRKGLVIFQFAVLVLLTLSVGTMYRQVRYVTNEAVHLDIDQVLLINTSCSSRFADRVSTLAGVKGIACSSAVAVGGATLGPKVLPDGSQVIAAQASVGLGFFELYGLHPLAGRFFSADHPTDAIRSGAAPLAKPATVVINETAVRKFNFGSPAAAIGQLIRFGNKENAYDAPPAEVIGVVSDFAINSIHDPVDPTIFFVNENQFGVLNVKLQGSALPETLKSIDDVWKDVGEQRPITRYFFDEKMERQFMTFERQAHVFTAFAGLALFIACLGLFGLSSFLAEQRTKEIGVRKAMGARTGDILMMFVWQFTKPVLWANVIAWPIGYLAMHTWLSDFAYHVDPEFWIFTVASGLAVLIAVGTVAAHVLLVARAQPVHALRYE